MRGKHGGERAPWGVPRSRRRPGNAEDDHDSQAAPCARHAGSLRDRTAGRARAVRWPRRPFAAAAGSRPEEGARPWPRHGDHPRPLLLPGPRPASRPALHSRLASTPIVTQADIRSTICKRGLDEPRSGPRSRRPSGSSTTSPTPPTARPGQSGPNSTTSSRSNSAAVERRHEPVAGVPADTEPEGQGRERPERRRLRRPRVSLAAAQQAIASDWMTAEKQLGIGPVVSGRRRRRPVPSRGAPPPLRPQTTAIAATTTSPSRRTSPTGTPLPLMRGTRGRDDTNSSGATTITLYYTSPGEAIRVAVGSASCSTRAYMQPRLTEDAGDRTPVSDLRWCRFRCALTGTWPVKPGRCGVGRGSRSTPGAPWRRRPSLQDNRAALTGREVEG